VFSFWTNKDYYYQFAKVVYNGSVVFEPNIPEIKGLGINIDIFPLDGMPDRLIGRRIHQDLLMFLNKLKAANVRLKFKAPSALKFFFRWRLLIRVIDMLGKRFSMDNTNYCGNIIVTTVRHKEIPIECFENTEWLDFENRKYPVPSGYDEYLKRLYGDYMKLPPKEKQIASHNVKAFLVT
ncbi:MAG: LicD family protein, partial [Clostridia bacterium]|nr:LicD family protein [Clostridia bacterium]